MNACTRPREQRQGNEGRRHPVDRLGHDQHRGHDQHDGHGRNTHGQDHGHDQHDRNGQREGVQFISSTLLRSCAELDLHATERAGFDYLWRIGMSSIQFTWLSGLGSA